MNLAAPVADVSWAAICAGPALPLTVLPANPPVAPRVAYDLMRKIPMPTSPHVAVVVPSNRPTSLAAWLARWRLYLGNASLYIVEDGPETWATIRADLGADAWIIPRETDCVRGWGYLQAMRAKADIILTMDDDVFPDYPTDGIAEHVRALTTPQDAHGWGRMLADVRTRGIPEGAPPVINHGLWTNVPDLDARMQLSKPPLPDRERYPLETILTMGLQYPISGMNLSWWSHWTPVLYFGLMGRHIETGVPWGVDRCGDIWAGLAAKRLADYYQASIRSGTPFVHHARASDPRVNLEKEASGRSLTPIFAHAMQTCPLPEEVLPLPAAARCLADAVGRLPMDYWHDYARAWHRWIDLTT